MKRSIYKVSNGKLLKIFLDDADGKIVSLKITGDFFSYPEENIEAIENQLRGIPLTKDALAAAIAHFLIKHPTSFFGLDTESLISTILNAS